VSQLREVVSALGALLAALPRARRRQLWGLSAIMPLAAFAEIASLDALVPFLSLLAAPSDSSPTGQVAAHLQSVFGLPAADTVIMITAAFGAIAVFAAITRIALHVVLARTNFRFQGTAVDGLKDIIFTISRGARVGIVGPTSSGKSTLRDILMRLLEPGDGDLRVDGCRATGANRGAWQENISHVPRATYLADASTLENVAIGVPKASISEVRVYNALERAQRADLAETIPQGLATLVGENGV